MKIKAALKILSMFLPDMESLPKILIYIIMLPIGFLSLFIISPTAVVETIPLAKPSQVDLYIEAADGIQDKYGVSINWQELLAIDAVRLNQNFQNLKNDQVVALAEMFIWEEEIEHESCYIDKKGFEICSSWTEIVYHKYSLDELLAILTFNQLQKDKAYIFLQTDLNQLRDVGNDMPEGWEPNINRLGWPVPGIYRVTSKFGPRIDPVEFLDGFHHGLDIGADSGTLVVAADEGEVLYADWSGNYGKAIYIQHESGFITRYAHLAEIKVSLGQLVSRGETIGEVGSTGKCTGPHLHFEIRINNNAVDPLSYY